MVELSGGGRRSLKRFYTSVDVAPRDGAFHVLLDGRPAKTPARAALALPTQGLADAVAAEWAAAADDIVFDDIRVTRLASTAIDFAAARADDWRGEIARYAAHDLLCYRAERPAALVARQAAAWDPFLDWARASLGAPLVAVSGVMSAPQPALALDAMARAAGALDAWRALGVVTATGLLGSAVLGLALERGAFEAATILAASRVDEDFQREQWGADAEAEARAARSAADFAAAARFLALLTA